jgi:pimeloyl-ACP methyl ester carboxylesterase
MLRQRVNYYDMAYLDIGSGRPLVCIHGSLGDFRSWTPVLGPLSKRHRLIVPSLRRFFPEHWDGKGGGFTIPQHVSDVIAFVEKLGLGKVDLMGHSRGGHIAFRVAQQRPDLLRKLILAEPGGELDNSLMPPGQPPLPDRKAHMEEVAERIAKGDVDGGLEMFLDRIDGVGTWAKRPEDVRQRLRDNARTLLGQVDEQRQPFTRAEAQAIRVPTLIIGGAETKGFLPVIFQALAKAIPGARLELIPQATHSMFYQAPRCCSEAVIEFLAQD